MLSTPPAFNLSQNQTLQLIDKTHWLCPQLSANKLKVFVPVRSSLFKEPTRFAFPLNGQPALFSESLIRCQAFFFIESFFSTRQKVIPKHRALSYTDSQSVVKHFFFAGPACPAGSQNPDFDLSNRLGELVHRSGEDGLCAFYHDLSTTFLQKFYILSRLVSSTVKFIKIFYSVSTSGLCRRLPERLRPAGSLLCGQSSDGRHACV